MLDWDDLRYFLAVAQHGTLSQAARALDVTQPTVGRRIANLERRLGAELFVRSAAGFLLSETGTGMLAHAEAMRDHALRAETMTSGSALRVEGPVRITASEWLVRSVIGPTVAALVAKHPGLELELLAEARHFNLVKREADIALRPSEFPHDSVFQRAVATLEFGLYASDSYLARCGAPDFAAGSPGHVLITMTKDMGNIVDAEWAGTWFSRAHVAARVNGREPMAVLAAAGVGVTCLPCFLGDATPGLRQLTTPAPSPLRKLWLGVHRSARRTPRIHVTASFLAESLRRLSAALHPSQNRS